jgi:hypothetical protein
VPPGRDYRSRASRKLASRTRLPESDSGFKVESPDLDVPDAGLRRWKLARRDPKQVGMPVGDQSRLAAWLDFAKALIWPSIFLIFSLTYHTEVADFIAHLTKVNAGPLSLEAQARDIQHNVNQASQPAQPKDPTPTREAIKQVLKLEALRTLAQVSPSLTSVGWIYCGAFAGGAWSGKPNLEVAGPINTGETYKVSTDTYLRESPPQGSTPKGEVIGVVPEGAKVKALQVSLVPDPGAPSSEKRLVWVQIENQAGYALSGHK